MREGRSSYIRTQYLSEAHKWLKVYCRLKADWGVCVCVFVCVYGWGVGINVYGRILYMNMKIQILY